MAEIEHVNTTPAKMAEAMLQCKGRIVVVAHVRPDGDAAGSALGLCLALKAAGRSAVCVGLEPLGREFDYLEGLRDIIPAEDYQPAEGDVMAVVDCGDFSRIAGSLRGYADKLAEFCIDHHKSNSGFAKMQLIDPDASSTAELIYRVATAGGMPISLGVAEALWTGLITDTGRFAYSNTSPESMRCGAGLLEKGVRTAMVNDMVYDQVDLRRLRLLSLLLDSIEVSEDGRVCVVSLSAMDYAKAGGDAVDSDNFVDVARSVAGTTIAAFLRQELETAPVHLSLRTRPPHDASEICAEWGGGGHERAAGATIDGDLESVREMVRERLEEIAASVPLEKESQE